MNKTVPLFEKGLPHISMGDWTRNVQDLQSEARTRRQQSWNLRQKATQLRHETDITTRWDYRINTDLLRDRIFDVSSWREKQFSCLERVRAEIEILQQEKNNTEAELEALQIPFMVVSKCLSTRDTRLRTELTHDLLDVELKKELSLLEHHKKVLMDACQAAWEKRNELTNVSNRLQHEIQNKENALALDYHARGLDVHCSGISLKLEPTSVPAESMTEAGYVECIENTLCIAEQLMRESKCVRESMFRAREQCANQLHEQRHRLEHVMRRRIYDTQRARNEMQWQLDKMDRNMVLVEREIGYLQHALANKTAPGKVAETRLDTRKRRPVLELVQDQAQDGLIEELQRIRLSESTLQQKLDDALSTYRGMCSHRERLRADLSHKEHALKTERSLVETRAPLPKRQESQLARNLGYLHMQEELAPLV